MGIISSLQGTVQQAQEKAVELAEEAADAAKTATIVNQIPGRGLLWEYDGDGFALKTPGVLFLGAIAAYGVIRFVGR